MTDRKGYADIAANYRRKINDGELRPGDAMPTVNELAEEEGVARNTAARAFSLLKSEGLITTRAGAGTVVSSPLVITGADRLERMTRTGLRYGPDEDSSGHRVMRRSVVDADVCRALDLEPGDEVVIRIRTFRQGGRPTSVGLSIYPPRTTTAVPELSSEGRMEQYWGDLYSERTGKPVSRGQRTGYARQASQDELDALEIDAPPHVAVSVLVTNVTFHDEEGPLGHWEDVYAPGERIPLPS